MEQFIGPFGKKDSNRGMTLVEVLVAIMALTIIIAAFAGFISWSFSNIFNMGEKSKAIAKAMEKIDQLTELVWNAESENEAMAALQNTDIGWVENEGSVDDSSKECVFYFTKERKVIGGTEIEGYNVCVVVFYQNHKYRVQLDSFILQYPEGV